MASTTIPAFGLSGNRHSGGSSGPWPGDSSCPTVRFDVLSADADSPGAYRYDPANHDPSIPESDPRSPRYEPPHLRHQPGDTWIIDRHRPHDPLDPGPYGAPGWFPDNRTGRHRRGELPDPAPDDSPARPQPRPSPTRRPLPRGGDAPPPSSRRRRWDDVDDNRRYDFGRLREEAWSSFLADSASLHDAHFAAPVGFRDRFVGVVVAVLRFFVPWKRTPEMRSAPRALDGTPVQGRPSPSPFLAQWERHFDTSSAVVL